MEIEELGKVVRILTEAIYVMGKELQLSPSDLSTVAAGACCNVHFWAHGPGGVEHMRNAADAFEDQILGQARTL